MLAAGVVAVAALDELQIQLPAAYTLKFIYLKYNTSLFYHPSYFCCTSYRHNCSCLNIAHKNNGERKNIKKHKNYRKIQRKNAVKKNTNNSKKPIQEIEKSWAKKN